MKIRLDFVSNSSSTSFVYISDGALNKDAFLKAVGVEFEGPVADIFLQMYYELRDKIAEGDKLTSQEEADKLESSYDFTPGVIERVRSAIEAGKTVVSASLSSDGSLAEIIMCTEIFEIESDTFYINAYQNYW